MVQEIKLNQIDTVVTTVGTPGTDGNLPTEKAVRDAIVASGGTGLQTVLKTGDQVLTASFADITDLTFALLANKTYTFEFLMILDANSTGTGLNVTCDGPATPTSVNLEAVYWDGSINEDTTRLGGYNADLGGSMSCGPTKCIYRVRGIVVNGANAGNLVARAKRESGGSGTCYTGSYGTIIQLD